MSEEDIAKGSRGNEVIAQALDSAAVGIICLTPENLSAPWILFEAGALSKSLGRNELVCPYLVDLEKRDVKPPLAQFQLTAAHEADTRRLVHAINSSLEAEYRAPTVDLDRRFNKWWPDLDALLQVVLTTSPPERLTIPHRSQDEVIAELLDLTRQINRKLGAPIGARLPLLGVLEPQQPVEEDGRSGWRWVVPGVKVRHPQFGEGTILKIASAQSDGSDARADIDFSDVGRKRIVVKYANLSPVLDQDESE
jgi:hypothetical protein